MSVSEQSLAADVKAVGRIDSVPAILETVCRITGMGFAAVARVTETRWIACAVRDEIAFGLQPGGELKVETTICDEIRDSGNGVIINEVSTDPQYCGHPTPAMYGFQSYISIPIRQRDGSFFGTLCAIDPKPAQLDRPEIVRLFELFARLIATELDTQDRLAASETALLNERNARDLREQFIAVLGHDLRNPLASIGAGVNSLRGEKQSAKGKKVLELMDSSIDRMGLLIENVLDFARSRLGSGLSIELVPNKHLADALHHIVAEARSTSPDRKIEEHISIKQPVACDVSRLSRLLSNLLGNAIAYGAADQPIRVGANIKDDALELSVINGGTPIPPDVAARIFQPFVRGDGQSREGLGLGLYIANEIARAHSGTLTVASDATETRFTFRMPITAGA